MSKTIDGESVRSFWINPKTGYITEKSPEHDSKWQKRSGVIFDRIHVIEMKYAEHLEAKCAELEMQLEFTKKYLNPEDTSFREMMNTFKELPEDKKMKLINLASSLAALADTKEVE